MRTVHVGDGVEHALAAEALVAVAQLERLVLPGRRAARHTGPPERTVVEPDVDLDGGVAARIEDLARVHGFDQRHRRVMLSDDYGSPGDFAAVRPARCPRATA